MKNSKFKDYCVDMLGKLNPRSTFLSVRGYHNNWAEVSDFSVVFHINYLNAIRKALPIVEAAKDPKSDNFSAQDLERAKAELLHSFEMTLDGPNPLYTCEGVYEPIIGADGKPIPGIRLHSKQGVVHLHAMKIRKKVIVPGIYSKTNSAPKTIAKRYLRSLTTLGNWVQFKLEPKRFDKLVVGKMTLKG